MFIQSCQLLQSLIQAPQALDPWLRLESSLTEKLRQVAGEAELKVLYQDWGRPNWWDTYTLGLTSEPVLHREILMFAQQTPCWYARTIIPQDTFNKNRTFFNKLQQESLGSLIFNEAAIQRNLLTSYVINNQNLEYYWLPDSVDVQQNHYFLRLSAFTFNTHSPFYLVEILLPGLMKKIQDHHAT